MPADHFERSHSADWACDRNSCAAGQQPFNGTSVRLLSLRHAEPMIKPILDLAAFTVNRDFAL